MSDKPFPRRCPQCRERTVYLEKIPYDARVKHDGHLYCFHIPALSVNKCGSCGLVTFDTNTDDEISQGLRNELQLLSPADIRKYLHRFGWKQKDFAEHLGTTQETVSRWLSGGHIQSRVMDKSMRNLFALEGLQRGDCVHVRDVVMSAGQLSFWGFSPVCPSFPTLSVSIPSETQIDSPPPTEIQEPEILFELARGPPVHEIVTNCSWHR